MGITLGAAAFARAAAPLVEFTADLNLDEFLQKHYTELTESELDGVLRRLEAETLQEYGTSVQIRDVPAQAEDRVTVEEPRMASMQIGGRYPLEELEEGRRLVLRRSSHALFGYGTSIEVRVTVD